MTLPGITMIALLGITSGDMSDYINLRQSSLAQLQSGHYFKAEEFARRAAEAAIAKHDDYAVALSYSALADILQAEGRFQEADELYRRSIAMLNIQPNRQHAAAVILRNLAASFTAQARYGEAFETLKKTSKLMRKHKIEDPQLRGQILNSLGIVYFYQDRMGDAENAFSHATESPLRPVTLMDVDLGGVLNNLGRVYQTQKQNRKAEDSYKRSLALQEDRYGSSHPHLTITMNNLGALYTDMGSFTQAESYFQRSLGILERTEVVFDEKLLMQTLHGLARKCIRESDGQRAQTLLSRAVEMARRNTSSGDKPEMIELLEDYSLVLRNLSKPVEAQHVQAEVKRIRASLAFTVPLSSLGN